MADPGTDPFALPDGSGGNNANQDNSGIDWREVAGKAAPAVGGLATSLFLNNPYTNLTKQTAQGILDKSAAQGAEGSRIAKSGLDTLGPVMAYLKMVTGGDAGSLEAATLPERNTVLRQYDTARQGAKFLPRGGGQSATMLDVNARQASDISNIIAKARTTGMSEAASLGKDVLATGINEERGATDALTSALGSFGKLQQQQAQQNKDTGTSIGGLLQNLLSGNKGGPTNFSGNSGTGSGPNKTNPFGGGDSTQDPNAPGGVQIPGGEFDPDMVYGGPPVSGQVGPQQPPEETWSQGPIDPSWFPGYPNNPSGSALPEGDAGGDGF